MIKAKGMKRWRLRVQPVSHIHLPEIREESKGISPHIPKWAPALGIGVPRDFQIFKKWFEGPKFIRLKSFLCHWNFFKEVDVQNGLVWSIWILTTQVMVEKKADSQNVNLIPNH
jgi:hypothetical protein